MRLKFKQQAFQTQAVNAVADCFEGQPQDRQCTHDLDRGHAHLSGMPADGYRNADIRLGHAQVLQNIRAVQARHNLPQSKAADEFTTPNNKGKQVPAKPAYRQAVLRACHLHLDIEMETGSGDHAHA